MESRLVRCLMLGWLPFSSSIWGQPPERIVVRGWVHDAQGQPLTRATVVCQGPNTHLSVETDAGGHFELPPVPPGDHQLTFSSEGFLDEQVALKLAVDRIEEGITVTLQRAVPVKLHLHTTDGEPVRHAKGHFFANGVGWGDLKTDEKGSCHLLLK